MSVGRYNESSINENGVSMSSACQSTTQVVYVVRKHMPHGQGYTPHNLVFLFSANTQIYNLVLATKVNLPTWHLIPILTLASYCLTNIASNTILEIYVLAENKRMSLR